MPKRSGVAQLDAPAVHVDQAFMGESREQPADGLQLETQVTADFFACHAQHELASGVAARLIAVRQIEKLRASDAELDADIRLLTRQLEG